MNSLDVRKKRYQKRIRDERVLAALLFGSGILFAEAASVVDDGVSWNSYRVYQPEITRNAVVNSNVSDLKYNHCSTIAFFDGHWICLWNANTVPSESQPGQSIYMSTSLDGLSWTAPELAFKDSARSENPIPCSLVQWQPVLINHKDQLWCFWSQLSFAGGEHDQYYGVYFSTLGSANGKWVNRRLLWDGSPDPFFDGKSWRILPMQNPTRLSSGRYLVPIIMIGPKLADAPAKVWNNEKRASVLYSDDDGVTWNFSEGTTVDGNRWIPWEPTVWEQPDGSVGMFFRNNDQRVHSQGGPADSEVLLFAESRDGGQTWSSPQFVPIQTVISRMYVMRQNQSLADVPVKNERYLMVHNAWPNQVPRFTRDRNAISLFINRGGGMNFVTGPNLSADQTIVSYPHMAIHSNDIFVSYTRGTGNSSIYMVRVSPQPKPDQYYLYPHQLPYPDTAAPSVSDGSLHFHGAQYADSKRTVRFGSTLHFSTWVFPELEGTMLDMQTSDGVRGPRFELQRGRLCVTLPGHTRIDAPSDGLPVYAKNGWMSSYMWYCLGVTLDFKAGTADFYVNGVHTGQQTFSPIDFPYGRWQVRLGANTAETGKPVQGFTGNLRSIVLWSGTDGLSAHDRLAQNEPVEFSRSDLLIDFRRTDWTEQVELPPYEKYGTVETARIDGVDALLIYGAAGAGVEAPVWHASLGDVFEIQLRSKLIEGDDAVVLTGGDLNASFQIVQQKNKVMIRSGTEETVVAHSLTGWVDLNIKLSKGQVTVTAEQGKSPVSIPFTSELNLVSLGNAFVKPGQGSRTCVAFDVTAFQTKVDFDKQK